jgi:hypothetical protein
MKLLGALQCPIFVGAVPFLVLVGCIPLAGLAEVSYLSPSVDAPGARYEYPLDVALKTHGVSTDVLPSEVAFDVGVVTVDAQVSRKCQRQRAIALIYPMPPIPIVTNDPVSVLNIIVAIKGKGVSVDPALVTLKDSAGKVVPIAGPYDTDWPSGTVAVYFKVSCDSSDTYELTLGGVSIDSHAIEVPTVHIARGTVRQVGLPF